MSASTVEELRTEAQELMAKDPGRFAMRTCWNCNPAHQHMAEYDDVVLLCFACGHWFFKGTDVTIIEKEGER